jgi:hypothetical protein
MKPFEKGFTLPKVFGEDAALRACEYPESVSGRSAVGAGGGYATFQFKMSHPCLLRSRIEGSTRNDLKFP